MYELNLKFTVLFICIISIFYSGLAVSSERVICAVLPVETSVIDGTHGLLLRIKVKNPTQADVEVEEFNFGTNMLRLRANLKEGGHDLTAMIPLLSPGVKPMLIKSKGEVYRDISLGGVFPDLDNELKRSAVNLSWILTLEPTSGCFSEEIKSSVVIDRR